MISSSPFSAIQILVERTPHIKINENNKNMNIALAEERPALITCFASRRKQIGGLFVFYPFP